MKSTIKLALVITFFSSAAFADGDMGTGGRTCPNGASTCLVASEPTQQKEDTATKAEDSILILVQEYLDSVFKYFEN